jgi:LemA protein
MEPNAPNAVRSANTATPVTPKPPIKPKTGCLGTTMIISLIFVLLLIIFIPGCVKYNGLVDREMTLKAKWTNVETYFQERAAKYNNIVDIVESSAKLENLTLVEVTEARSHVSNINVEGDSSLTNENIQNIENELSGSQSAFSKLLAVNEAYPDLKFPDQYTSLKSDVLEIETKVATAKTEFNDACETYNKYRNKFPGNFYGWMFGFEKSYLIFETKGAEFDKKYSPEENASENKKLITK